MKILTVLMIFISNSWCDIFYGEYTTEYFGLTYGSGKGYSITTDEAGNSSKFEYEASLFGIKYGSYDDINGVRGQISYYQSKFDYLNGRVGKLDHFELDGISIVNDWWESPLDIFFTFGVGYFTINGINPWIPKEITNDAISYHGGIGVLFQLTDRFELELSYKIRRVTWNSYSDETYTMSMRDNVGITTFSLNIHLEK